MPCAEAFFISRAVKLADLLLPVVSTAVPLPLSSISGAGQWDTRYLRRKPKRKILALLHPPTREALVARSSAEKSEPEPAVSTLPISNPSHMCEVGQPLFMKAN
jgi:hypothetical protein